MAVLAPAHAQDMALVEKLQARAKKWEQEMQQASMPFSAFTFDKDHPLRQCLDKTRRMGKPRASEKELKWPARHLSKWQRMGYPDGAPALRPVLRKLQEEVNMGPRDTS